MRRSPRSRPSLTLYDGLSPLFHHFLNLREKLKKEEKANDGFALGKMLFFTPSVSCPAQACLRKPLVGTETEMTDKVVRKFQPKLQPCVSSKCTGVILGSTVRG